MINEKQYQQLCSECDKLLYIDNGNGRIVSVSWLHVIREHPIFLKNYFPIFMYKASNVYLQAYVIFKKILLCFIKNAAHLLGCLFSKNEYFYLSRAIHKDIDFLIVSHLLRKSDIGSEEDFYFNTLISDLEKKGFNIVVALINHTNLPCKKAAKGWRNSHSPRIIFSKKLSFYNELDSFISMLRTSFHIFKIGNKTLYKPLGSFFFKYAAAESLTGSSFTNYRRYKQISHFLKSYEPKSVVLTYEGHAWERLVISAANAFNKNIITIGYQHAALFRLQHALSRCISVKFDPQLILVPGQRSFDLLKIKPASKSIQFEIIGSNRGGEDHIEYYFPINNFKVKSEIKILIAPEGIISECVILFDYVLAQAIKFPEINFYLQLHPIIDKKHFTKTNPSYSRLPNNVCWSSVKEISNNFYTHILYRGTTMVVKAAINGLQPIYFMNDENEMSIDLFYDINDFKLVVSHGTDLKDAITKYRLEPIEKIKLEYEKMKKYCHIFYSPYNYDILPNAILHKN